MTDKTGNRRFYPVKVNASGYNLFDQEDECRAYIKQCWAEAKALFDEGKLQPFADRALYEIIRARQSEAVEDDYRVGMIQQYLENKDTDEVCVLELWQNALQYSDYSKPDKKDSTEIGLIMQNFTDWEKMPKTKRFAPYGMQRYWRRIVPRKIKTDDFEEIF